MKAAKCIFIFKMNEYCFLGIALAVSLINVLGGNCRRLNGLALPGVLMQQIKWPVRMH